MTIYTLLAKRDDLEAELQEALYDQRFYAEAQESDPVLSPHNSEYLRACREVDRLTDRLQALDEKIDFHPH